MQNEKPDIHIIGHWTYPANTTKTMNVIANNVDSVEFFVNGDSRGKVTEPHNGYYPEPRFMPSVLGASSRTPLKDELFHFAARHN
jgi:hypothetical protein